MLNTRLIEDPKVFNDLAGEWNALLQASRSDTLFLTWEWLHTWWTHFGRGRRLCLVTAWRGRELVALAPLFASSRGLGRFMPTLEFLGTGTAGSDYLDVILKRGDEEEGRAALAAQLAELGCTLRLRQLLAGRSAAADLLRPLSALGWGVGEETTDVCPFIDLAGHTFESYLSSLGPEHRYNFRRRERNLHRRANLVVEPVQDEAHRQLAFRALLQLHDRRWRPRGGSDAFDAPGLSGFHDELSRKALERGWLRLLLVRLDGEPAAALYGFRYGRKFFFYQSGFDPRFAKWSLGLVTLGIAIRGAIEEGAEEFDLLHGDEAYKFLWAREVRELARAEAYPPGIAGRSLARALRVERATRRLGRRVLPAPVLNWIRAALAAP